MSLEQTIRDTVMSESMDLDGRLQQLVRAGLMPSNTLPLLRKAIAKVQGGMSLQGPERDVMATFINSMMYIVLGDDTIFNKARAGAKNYATEEVELDENAKIVAHLVKRYGDNVRKSHVMSAAKDFGVDASKLSKAVRKHLGKTMLEAKEKQEYDYEGDMAMSQLKSIIANSQRMHDMLSDDTNLPEWVQSKITLAEDYLSTAANYMQGEMNEAVGDYTVKTISPADAYKKHTGQMTKKSKVPVDPKTGKTLYQKVTSEEKEDDLPFEGPYRKTGERKDKYGNTVKNVAKHLAKKAMKANEEVEEIDEISKATMGRYINKAKDSIDLTAWRQGYKENGGANGPSSRLEKKLSKRHKGIETAVKKLTREESEQIDEVRGKNKQYIEITHHLGHKTRVPVHPTNAYKALNHYNNDPSTKSARIVSEEQIDELSKKTLGSYVNKAAERIGSTGVTAGLKIAADEKSSAKFKDMGKRQKGISRAVTKLTTEEEQIDELSYATLSRYRRKAKSIADNEGGKDRLKGRELASRKSYGGRMNGVKKAKVMATEGRRAEAMNDIAAIKQMNESYKTTFDAALEQYGIKSPSELDEEKRKEFFNLVDQNYKKGDQ